MRFLLAAALLAPLSASAQTAPVAVVDAPIVAEGRAFMAAYARELRKGDRKALADRYDRQGAWFVGGKGRGFDDHAGITRLYAGDKWSPPKQFDWHDLAFEPISADALLVFGGFSWESGDGKGPTRLSYMALLKRQDGVLRIRLEREEPEH